MNYATNFAIVENGLVTNVAWCTGTFAASIPCAVEIGDADVQVGDAYVDGSFFRAGQPLIFEEEGA